MPILVLAVVLVWLAFANGFAGSEAGPGMVDHARPQPTAPTEPMLGPMFIIAVGPDRAEEVRELLRGEASLRAALGEELRTAEVIAAASNELAERIATAVRTELVFQSSNVAVVVH